jgi:hypothetical protein
LFYLGLLGDVAIKGEFGLEPGATDEPGLELGATEEPGLELGQL